jgi:hypothetical protein
VTVSLTMGSSAGTGTSWLGQVPLSGPIRSDAPREITPHITTTAGYSAYDVHRSVAYRRPPFNDNTNIDEIARFEDGI